MEKQLSAGEWTAKRPVTDEDLKVFEQALSGLVGVYYTPLEVSTQVVAGINYCFICRAEIVIPVPNIYYVEVYIFKPLQGNPIITQIIRLKK